MQVKIALGKCKSKGEILAGALLLKALTVSAPNLFVAEIKSKPAELENFISAIMKDKEATFRYAGNMFLECFLKVIERKDKAQWFRKLYDDAKYNITKGLELARRTVFMHRWYEIPVFDRNQLVVVIRFAGYHSHVIHGGLLVIGQLLEQSPAKMNPLANHVHTTQIFQEIQQKHVRRVVPVHG